LRTLETRGFLPSSEIYTLRGHPVADEGSMNFANSSKDRGRILKIPQEPLNKQLIVRLEIE